MPNKFENEEIDLATWIGGLRRAIIDAQQKMVEEASVSGEVSDVLFQFAEVRFDLEVKVERKSTGGAEVGAGWMGLKVLSGKIGTERTRGHTQKISITLRPFGNGAVLGPKSAPVFMSPQKDVKEIVTTGKKTREASKRKMRGSK